MARCVLRAEDVDDDGDGKAVRRLHWHTAELELECATAGGAVRNRSRGGGRCGETTGNGGSHAGAGG